MPRQLARSGYVDEVATWTQDDMQVRDGREDGDGRERDLPLAAYATLTGFFATLVASFAAWFRRSGRELPERVSRADLALASVATHKLSRVVTKDRVTSAVRAPFTEFEGSAGPAEVEERARGVGLRRAVGELLVCPYCLDLWIAAAITAGLLVAPRATRWAATVLNILFASDVLQLAYKRLEDAG